MSEELTVMRDTSHQDIAVEPKRRIWPWVLVGLFVVAAAFASSSILDWSRSDRSVTAERLRFATVERGSFVRDTSVQGQVVAAISPTLYSPAGGIVKLSVQPGDTVTIGDTLATMNSPELVSRLDQEQAGLVGMQTELKRQEIDARQRKLAQQKVADNAKVVLTAARRELRRAEDAFEKNAISQIDFERARDEMERAQLEHTHALEEQALLSDAISFELETQAAAIARQRLLVRDIERQVSNLQITSPVAGMVGNILVNDRAVVAANEPLITVVDLTAFEIDARVPESYANSLALGMPVEINYRQEQYAGQISAVSPEVASGYVSARIRFTGEVPEGLRQNQRVSSRILFDQRDDALFVRRGPFYDSGGGRIAYVIDGDTAVRKSIVTGATSIDKIEILDGLESGDQIIISNISGFEDADRILLNQ